MELHLDILSLSIGTLMGLYVGFLIWHYIPPTSEERIIKLELQLSRALNRIDSLKKGLIKAKNTNAILLRKLRGLTQTLPMC
jgi:uncharacterized membrane-anchored protein YhcB (DUF1043 family)